MLTVAGRDGVDAQPCLFRKVIWPGPSAEFHLAISVSYSFKTGTPLRIGSDYRPKGCPIDAPVCCSFLPCSWSSVRQYRRQFGDEFWRDRDLQLWSPSSPPNRAAVPKVRAAFGIGTVAARGPADDRHDSGSAGGSLPDGALRADLDGG
jgi:hypothetical protein